MCVQAFIGVCVFMATYNIVFKEINRIFKATLMRTVPVMILSLSIIFLR